MFASFVVITCLESYTALYATPFWDMRRGGKIKQEMYSLPSECRKNTRRTRAGSEKRDRDAIYISRPLTSVVLIYLSMFSYTFMKSMTFLFSVPITPPPPHTHTQSLRVAFFISAFDLIKQVSRIYKTTAASNITNSNLSLSTSFRPPDDLEGLFLCSFYGNV